MKQLYGVWLPDSDIHFQAHLKVGPYQRLHRETALAYCSQFRTAVDVGAHVGTWSMELEKRFYSVHAFEPIPENLDCLARNTKNTTIHPVALGDGSRRNAVLSQVRAGNSGTWAESDRGEIVADSRTLDSFLLRHVDFLKIDAECAELDILRGAVETIVVSRPVICLELRPSDILRKHNFPVKYEVQEVVDFLLTLGFRQVDSVVADCVFIWKGVE